MNKPKLSIWQIINMNLGFFGIQYSFGLQQSAVNPIYDFLGAQPHELPILNLAGPLTGLIIQPIIGALSDKTWHPIYGRRKPYFFIGAIMCSIALFFFPFSSELWMAVGLLWILDIGNNTAMEPYRAFVADKLDRTQQSTGFQAQSFFTGLGQTLANLSLAFFPAIFIGTTGKLPTWVFASFMIGAVLSIATVWWSMKTTPEIPPTDEEIEEIKKFNAGKPNPVLQILSVLIAIAIGPIAIYALLHGKLDNEILNLLILPICLFWVWFLFSIIKKYPNNKLVKILTGVMSPFIEIANAIKTMPKIMWGLALVYMFQWYALFCYWQNSGKAVAKNAYGWQVPNSSKQLDSTFRKWETFNKAIDKHTGTLNLSAPEKEKLNALSAKEKYDTYKANVPDTLYNGAQLDSINFLAANKKLLEKGSSSAGGINAWYNIVTFLVAFILVFFANRYSPKLVHFVCLLLSGLGFIWFSQINQLDLFYVAITGFGIGWASMMGIPYMMVVSDIPKEKYGVYMGIINMMIVIPMFIQTVTFGYVMKNILHNDSSKAILIAGVMLLIAAACTLLLKPKQQTTDDNINFTGGH